MKKGILAFVAVFLTFAIIDWIVHGVILMSSYEATAHLWRDPQEMNMLLMSLMTVAFSVIFVLFYVRLVSEKNTGTGLLFGFFNGVLFGISMGGFYFISPIPGYMALVWFLEVLLEMTLAGLWLGMIFKKGSNNEENII